MSTWQGEPTLASELSAAVAGVMSEFYGRGPGRSRTYIFDRLVFCVLEDPFTIAEQALLAAGEGDLVRESRMTFQDIMGATFIAEVERLTARPVVGYHSQIVLEPARALEWFLLDPAAPPPRIAHSDDAPVVGAPGVVGDADAAASDADAFAAHVPDEGGDGRTRAAIANAVNRLMSEHVGRGATASRAYVYDGGALCILDGALTTVEHTLAAGAQAPLARRLRRAITESAREPLLREVGEILGCRLVAVEAQLVFSPDAVLLAFIADPTG